MATVERVTQEGLPLTPAMRRYARRTSLWRIIAFALFFLSGPLTAAVVLSEELPPLDLELVLVTGFSVLGWAAITAAIGFYAAAAYRAARDGTHTRYVGPFDVQEEHHHKGGTSFWLDLDGTRVALHGAWRIRSEDVDRLSMRGSGVVDWLPGFGVLVVWDDRGNCIYRTRGYGADPDLAPPPPAPRRSARQDVARGLAAASLHGVHGFPESRDRGDADVR